MVNVFTCIFLFQIQLVYWKWKHVEKSRNKFSPSFVLNELSVKFLAAKHRRGKLLYANSETGIMWM